MEELTNILSEFGATGLWAVVLYKGMGSIELFGAFGLGVWLGVADILIGWGIKKAWPSIKTIMEDF